MRIDCRKLVPVLLLLCLAAPVSALDVKSQVYSLITLDATGAAGINVKAELPENGVYGPDWRQVDAKAILADAVVDRVLVGLERVTTTFTDFDRAVHIDAWSPDMAQPRNGRFEVDLPGRATIVHSDADVVVAVHHRVAPDGSVITFVNKYVLPAGSFFDNYDISTGVMAYRPGATVAREWREIKRMAPVSAPADLSGHWEARRERNETLPPGVSTIFLDISTDGVASSGNVILEHRQLNLPMTVLRLQECKIDGNLVTLQAHLYGQDAGQTSDISFSFQGALDVNILRGAARYEKHTAGRVERVSAHDMVFFRVW